MITPLGVPPSLTSLTTNNKGSSVQLQHTGFFLVTVGTRNYRVLDPVTLKVTGSHDVSFDERSFPFSSFTPSGPDLEVSELFEDIDIPDFGPSDPSRRLVLRLGPDPVNPPPTPSPAPSSSAY